jgi:hypothetical protein
MPRYARVMFTLTLFISLASSKLCAQVHWIKDDANPVMSGSGPGTWDSNVQGPDVLYNTDSARYEMCYMAPDANNDDWRPFRLGFAVSEDGIHWTKYPDPIMDSESGAWDETFKRGKIIRENGQYKMWYLGGNESRGTGGIGYATSPDGLHWTKDTLHNPVMVAGTEWEAGVYDIFSYFYVLPVAGEGYKMWYSGISHLNGKRSIGYASSSDGIIWHRDTLHNPVLRTENVNAWDYSVFSPQVILLDSVYHMFYLGWDVSQANRKIGWATSADGIHWNKYNNPNTISELYVDSDPVMEPGIGDQWDATLLKPGAVMREGNALRMWYDGTRDPQPVNLWHIGHAVISLDTLNKYLPSLDIGNISTIPVPHTYSLKQNYPNPFNPTTTIEFQIPSSEFVFLRIYNLLGAQVATLVSEKLTPGWHIYRFDGSRLASGVYYYQLIAGDFKAVKKMILLR